MFKAQSQNRAGKATFYMFEIAALAVVAIFFILAIVNIAQGAGFAWFLQYLVEGAFYGFILFGLGRVVDLLYCKAECHAKKEEKEEK